MWIIGSWIFPIISAAMWLATLLVLFIRWEITGHPIYPSMEAGQTIAYISDTGAYSLKPLFIAGCTVTTVFLDLAFINERWLRHTGRLAKNTSRSQKILSVLAIIFAIGGSAGLILLSCFDTYHYPRLHDGFLLLFIAGFILNAIFMCAEYQRLGIHYRNHRIIRISFWVKLTFIIIEVLLAIAFVSTSFSHHRNIAAVFEWLVALLFTGYILTFVIDLLPSVKTKNHIPQGFRDGPSAEKGQEPQQNLTNDSAGPNDNVDGGYRGTAAHAGGQPNGHKPVQRPLDNVDGGHRGEGTYTNGQTNGHTHGQTNGYTNAQTNGFPSGQTNGYSNNQTNGYLNDQTNGYTNGQTGGLIYDTVTSESQQQKQPGRF